MNIKVAVVDDPSFYSWKLIQEGLTKEGVKVIFYGPVASGRILGPENRVFKSKKVWTAHLYPVQVFIESLLDKPDVVHIQYEINTFGRFYTNLLFPFLLLLLRLSGSKVVVTVHSTFTGTEISSLPAPRVVVRSVLTLFYKLIEKSVNMIIVHAQTFKDLLVKYYKLPAKKIAVIPHGIPTDEPPLNTLNSKELISWTRYRRVILCFGVLSPRKGLEYLLEAYAKVVSQCPRCVLVIAGEEPIYYRGYKRRLKLLAKSLGIERQACFTGFVSDEVAHHLFSLAEVVALPYTFSVSASGPLSIAMQHHKPVVATRTVYFSKVLRDGKDALLVPPRNSEELADAIIRLLKGSSLRTQLAENIKVKAGRCSWREIAKTTIRTYKKLLTHKHPD